MLPDQRKSFPITPPPFPITSPLNFSRSEKNFLGCFYVRPFFFCREFWVASQSPPPSILAKISEGGGGVIGNDFLWCAHLFVWLEKCNFSAGYTCFLVGLFFFYGAGGRRVPQSPMILARRRRKKFVESISLKKNTSLKITNSLSCEHFSELSNGRQLCTFLGFISCLAHRGRKKIGSVPFGSPRRRRKTFWGFCLICLKKLPVIHISTLEFQKAASHTHFWNLIFSKKRKKKTIPKKWSFFFGRGGNFFFERGLILS